MSLEGQSETLKDQDQVQLATCSFEISKDKELGKQEHEARNTLDSDETLPNIELDTVIDNNNLNEPNQNLSEDTHINEQDINENQLFEQEDDDFGSFDQVDDDFDEDQPQTPVFETLQEALDIWQNFLNQIYQYKPLISFTSHAPKSIRIYVLEEAPESLRSRLTWDSVTRYMDNDTGIPKVRWYQSEIEKLHLKALACKRSAVPILHTGPTMLDINSYQSIEPINNETVQSVSEIDVPSSKFEDITMNTTTENSTPTSASEKRSSVFGLSSLSRYLPHLSKTNLPKSPTSPISPMSLTPSRSLHPIPTTTNPMNIRSTNDNQQQTSNDIGLGKLRRSNTVAFSSIRAKASNNSILNILDDEQDIKPRLTSFHASTKPPPPVRMDLFDLTDDDQVLKSPTSLQFNASNFKPLVPIVSPISPATSTTVTNRRNTLPARTRPDATTVLTNGGLDIDDDEFGDFTGEQDNDFGDFTTTTTTSRVTFNNNDDPFGILSCIQPSSHQSKSMSTSQPPSTMILTPTTSSPKVIEESFFDLLSPIETASTVQTDVDLFDFNADITSTNAVTDQNNAAKVPVENKIDNDDDDDWGDWAF